MNNHGAALFMAILLLLSISFALADDPFCKEIEKADDSPWDPWNPDCRRRNTRKTCSQGYGIRPGYGINASCVWHHLEPAKLTEIVSVNSNGWGLAVPGDYYQNLGYRGTFCSLKVTASLDKASAGMLGVYLRLFGGPLGNSLGFKLGQIDPEIQQDQYTQNYPVRPATSSGCTAGLGGPTSCSAKIVAPHGYALDPRFGKRNLASGILLRVDFFTKKYVKQFAKYTDSKGNEIPFRFKLKHEWARCKATKKPRWPKEILSSDSVLFGSTPFNRAQQRSFSDYLADYYYTVSYRVYDISFVSGVHWKVSISRPQGKKTPLTVFLFERGSNKIDCYDTPEKCNLRMPLFWGEKVTDGQVFGDCPKHKNCVPPKKLAIKGTFCNGTACSGKVRGLNPSKLYSLFVSYPRFDDPFAFARVLSDEEVGKSPPPKPVKSPYTTQLVNVKLVPKYWRLGKVQKA